MFNNTTALYGQGFGFWRGMAGPSHQGLSLAGSWQAALAQQERAAGRTQPSGSHLTCFCCKNISGK